jgi:hypothetical protein
MSSGLPSEQRVRAAREQSGIEQRRHILGRDRSVGDAAGGVATSTMGSSQNMPREPLRTILASRPRA